jgi:hypothetical protein
LRLALRFASEGGPLHQCLPRMLGTLMLGSRLAAETLPGAVALAQQPRLNILFILADNFGYGDLGVYGGGELRGAPTPSREASEPAGRELDAILKFLNSTILKSL